MRVEIFPIAAIVYGLTGCLLAVGFVRSPDGRRSGAVQCAATATSLLGGAGLIGLSTQLRLGESIASGDPWSSYNWAVQAYQMFAAGLCHLPTLIYVAVQQGGRWLDFLMGSASPPAAAPSQRPLTTREEHRLIESCLEQLARKPLDYRARERLAASYRRLGQTDAAIRQYQRAADSVDSGYDHCRLLYKTVWLMVEEAGQTRAALPWLRRLVRLYGKSYFAAYARRVLNHYEAHTAAGSFSEGPARSERPERSGGSTRRTYGHPDAGGGGEPESGSQDGSDDGRPR